MSLQEAKHSAFSLPLFVATARSNYVAEGGALSPMTRTFFTEINFAWIIHRIVTIVAAMDGHMQISVPLNQDFMDTVVRMARQSQGLASDPAGLFKLNEAIAEHEAQIYFYSAKHEALFDKYFIRQNRIKVFPYGAPTKITRGELTIDPSGRTLSDPASRWQAQYLRATAGLRNRGGRPSDGWCKIPGFLHPPPAELCSHNHAL